jgi:NAD(P)-dependent dehydrogenase (short-subunit alcohol dehydrogenase family)
MEEVLLNAPIPRQPTDRRTGYGRVRLSDRVPPLVVARRRNHYPANIRWIEITGAGHPPDVRRPRSVVALLLHSTGPRAREAIRWPDAVSTIVAAATNGLRRAPPNHSCHDPAGRYKSRERGNKQMGLTLKPVRDQVVVVMGASSGIGRATALRLAGEGAKVVVAARGEPALRSLVEEIRASGGEATAVVADVSDLAQVQAVADRAVSEYGRLDTWVHVAAVIVFAAFEHTTAEEFQRVINVNLMGQVYGAMAALPHLKRTGRGALIHVSSMGAKRSIPLQSAYCASKHGLDGFVESLRVELQHDEVPISVTNVMPATINTPLFDNARTKLGVKPVAPPPVYPPHIVADAILYAVEHPVRDLVVGGAAKALILTQATTPRLLDALLRRFGYQVHYTDDRKPEDAPDNLFRPLPEHHTVEGSVGEHARRRSLYTWLELHPPLKRAVSLGAVAAMWTVLRGTAAQNRRGTKRLRLVGKG